jgi:hypothetical protein
MTGMMSLHGMFIWHPAVREFSRRRRYHCGAEALNLLQRLLHIHRILRRGKGFHRSHIQLSHKGLTKD